MGTGGPTDADARTKITDLFGYKQCDFPVTEKVAAEILSLPMYPQPKIEQKQRVVQRVEEQ